MPALTTGENAGMTWDGKMLMSDPDGTSAQEGVTIGYFLNNLTKQIVRTKSADFTVLDLNDTLAYGFQVFECTNTIIGTLPNSSATNIHRPWTFLNKGTGLVTITTTGGTQIIGNGGARTKIVISPGESLTLLSNGSGYLIFNYFSPDNFTQSFLLMG